MTAVRWALAILFALAGLMIIGFGSLMIIAVILGFLDEDRTYSVGTDLLGAVCFGVVPVIIGITLWCGSVVLIKQPTLSVAALLLSSLFINREKTNSKPSESDTPSDFHE